MLRGFPKRCQRLRNAAGIAHLDVDVVGLQHTANIGAVGVAASEPFDAGGLGAECLQKRKGKLGRIKRLRASSDIASSISTAFMRLSRG